MRRAQGIEMNTIIIAALALIVLIVLIVVFTGNVQIVGQESQCESRGGRCLAPSECNFVRTAYQCSAETVCCINPSEIT